MIEHPHGFWQELYPPDHFAPVAGGWDRVFPGTLPDGRQIALPIRVLPGDGQQAVASLIVNQASFAVEAALVAAMAEALRRFDPEVVVGVPTLGLTLAAGVARALGHARMVALGTSRKFWYDEALSEPMTSITSPDQAKRVYLDPRMLPLFASRRVVLVDDVASSGRTLAAVLRLLARAGIVPEVAAFAMLQGEGWRAAVA
ncbi:MAG: phosphoribosyltransferase, partial [Phaeovulum sp.]|uniref:phosphoribosyltransferase n=1 Tax=Phaeovulum sp. TaxID=2934796 RepID=UPI002737261F